MTDDRKSGLALIAGMSGTIITMAFHPTGHDLIAPGQFASMARLGVAVHSLALVCMPVLFLGALGLTRRLASPNRLALSGLVFFGFAEIAGMIAATVSGLVAPGLIHHMMSAEPAAADIWRTVLQLNGHLNQAFALVLVVASSTAIVLWSAAMLRSGVFSRALALYGCVLGPVIVIAVASGHIRLHVHGFGLVILGQAVWFISTGVLLWRAGRPADHAASV